MITVKVGPEPTFLTKIAFVLVQCVQAIKETLSSHVLSVLYKNVQLWTWINYENGLYDKVMGELQLN